MEKLTPEVPEATGGAPEPMEEVAEEATVAAGGEEVTTSPEAALEVVIRSPEIQDAEPIRSAPMTEAAASSRGGIELLTDDLVDPATVTRHLEAVRQAEQWMKVSSQSSAVEYSCDMRCLCRTSWRGPARSPTCCKSLVTRCSGLKHWRISFEVAEARGRHAVQARRCLCQIPQ
jgi:uncharacterized membrane protein